MQDLGSQTKDGTHSPCSGSTEQPQNHQKSPDDSIF